MTVASALVKFLIYPIHEQSDTTRCRELDRLTPCIVSKFSFT